MADEEEKPQVAFLGPKATYTHQAALLKFPPSKYTHISHPTITSIFQAIQAKKVPHGVVPFENSSNGPVGFTLDLFADPNLLYPSPLIEAEIYLPVHHCLVGHTVPTDNFNKITKLYSHPQAWTQCSHFLDTHFPTTERIDVSSTSRGAELVAADTSGTSAAISSKLAAELNQVPVLAEGIEDIKGNTTRFFVLRHEDSPLTFPPSKDDDDDSQPPSEEEQEWKSLISFRLKQGRQSGALAESLGVFAKHGVNLTSILSRPSREAAWHYVFFVEVQGRRRRERGSRVDVALEELGRVVEGWRWLGSWVDQRT
ncbi:related to prephenate dehydratase [Ramularia collo-cygni]|uniref:prephenate dehydratase n=1 Tax=Ramularia collo-cygni TaxID=112498 RepID=A0A2D3UV21_9PEZI|nr:related to prephenate dehydratase [Ramularia collo-cygni]CZT21522.1 related to prephenate dehydratase [Ramularia collo-cygni]